MSLSLTLPIGNLLRENAGRAARLLQKVLRVLEALPIFPGYSSPEKNDLKEKMLYFCRYSTRIVDDANTIKSGLLLHQGGTVFWMWCLQENWGPDERLDAVCRRYRALPEPLIQTPSACARPGGEPCEQLIYRQGACSHLLLRGTGGDDRHSEPRPDHRCLLLLRFRAAKYTSENPNRGFMFATLASVHSHVPSSSFTVLWGAIQLNHSCISTEISIQ